MISLTHQFQSAKADGPDSTQVQPSNWNAQHVLNMATARIIGRTTAGSGPAEEISIHSSLMLSAGVLALATNPTVAGNLIVSGTFEVGGTSQMTGSVGIGGGASASALLDVQSVTKGVLFPRMTTTQRDAISAPATGLVIYNTTTSRLEIYSSGTWGPLTTLTYASEAEAIAGTEAAKPMSPLRTQDAITGRLADNGQAVGGTDNTTLMTPLRTAQAIDAMRPEPGQAVFSTASGTAFDLINLPAGITRIWGHFSHLSLSGTDNFIMQLGTDGVFVTTGYSGGMRIAGANTTSASGFGLRAADGLRQLSGSFEIKLTDAGWIYSAVYSANEPGMAAGEIVAAGVNCIRLTRTGTNTFDSGTWIVNYG